MATEGKVLRVVHVEVMPAENHLWKIRLQVPVRSFDRVKGIYDRVIPGDLKKLTSLNTV
jgi:hypothetical protein